MAFHDLGFRVIADDVCVISSGTDGSLVAHAGIPRLRIWEDALSATGRHSKDYAPSFVGDEDYRKFDVPMPADMSRSAPLAAIFLLSEGDDVQLAPLAGAEAIDALFANTYRGGFIPAAGNAQDHWRACIGLVSRVPLFRLNRPLVPGSIGEITKLFEEGVGLMATQATEVTER
jgi:hypothetical protein